MKVVCISNSAFGLENSTPDYNLFGYNPKISLYRKNYNLNYLTIDKVYDAVPFELKFEIKVSENLSVSDAYKIICDDGVERSLLTNMFINLSCNREKIINEILKL